MSSLPPLPNTPIPPETSTGSSRPWLRWVIIGAAIVGILVTACCAVSIFGGFRLFQTIQAESDQIKPVIRAFLDAGQQQDSDAALALFSDDDAATATAASLDRLFRERPEIFAGYSDITISSINISATTDGTIAQISGEVTYPSAPGHSYSATLRKDGESWKLVRIQFTDGV